MADENGSTEPLRAYKEKTLVIVLPGDLTVFDIGKKKKKMKSLLLKFFFSISEWLSVWCIAFFVDFGHVQIPKNLNIPPSLRMLGVEPQTKLNCEVLDPSQGFEVRWAIGKITECLIITEIAEITKFIKITMFGKITKFTKMTKFSKN